MQDLYICNDHNFFLKRLSCFLIYVQNKAWLLLRLETWLIAAPATSGDLALVQQRGREALRRQPIPSSRNEDWRFTDLALLQTLPLTAASPAPAALPEVASGALRLNWNGSSDPLVGQALPAGLQQLSADEIAQGLGHTLAAAGCERHWPVELNHAAAEHVLALRVTSRSQVSLELVSAASAGLQALRLLLLLEEKAELDLSQLIEAQGSGLHSLVIEAHLARGARLSHGLVALGQADAALLAHVAMEQEPESEAQLSSVDGWTSSSSAAQERCRIQSGSNDEGCAAEFRVRSISLAARSIASALSLALSVVLDSTSTATPPPPSLPSPVSGSDSAFVSRQTTVSGGEPGSAPPRTEAWRVCM